MALFSYECPEHGAFKVSLPRRQKLYHCPECGAKSKVILRAGSVQILERLDNGAMARAVERIHNIEEIMEERSTKHTKDNLDMAGINVEED